MSNETTSALTVIEPVKTTNRKRADNTIFELRDDGLYRSTDGLSFKRAAPYIKYLGHASDQGGGGSSYVLSFRDKNGVIREVMVDTKDTLFDPKQFGATLMKKSYPASIRKELAYVCQYVIQAAQESTTQYLLVCVSGWHNDHFLIGNTVISPEGSTLKIVLDGKLADKVSKFGVSGTLEKWQKYVAARCRYSHRMTHGLLSALAAPLAALMNVQGGGFNYSGEKGAGKSALMTATGSIYGGGPTGYYDCWDMTEGGAETQTLIHSDLILLLDELARFDTNPVNGARRLPLFIHKLADAQCRKTSHQHTGGSELQSTRNIFLSTSEKSITQYMIDGKADPYAPDGYLSRLVDIPLATGTTTGIFESIPKMKGGKPHRSFQEFAKKIAVSATENYGHAGRTFLQKVVQDLHDDRKKLVWFIRDKMTYFEDKARGNLPSNYDDRVLVRFALAYAAGELALHYGVLPKECNNIFEAIEACLIASLGTNNAKPVGNNQKGTTTLDFANSLRALISAKDSSVLRLGSNEKVGSLGVYQKCKVLILSPRKGHGERALIKPEVFDALFEKSSVVAKRLFEAGVLIRGSQGRFKIQKRIPGLSEPSKVDMYCIKLEALEDMVK